MKIFISSDMEGTNGIVSPSDVVPGGDRYEEGRVLMTEEVNAVIDGLFFSGVNEVTVCDSHEVAKNLRYDLLDKRASLIMGSTRPDSMVHSIDESYDGLILLGHHAMFGAEKAVLDHTYDQFLVRELKLNGSTYGEVGINALLAAESGVPLIMTSGDDALYWETVRDFKDCEVAVVKEAMGRYCAKCLPKEESLKLLRDTAIQAVKGIENKKAHEMPDEFLMEITFQQTVMADGAIRVSGVKRTGPMTIQYMCSSMKDFMRMRQIILQAAAEFYDPRF